MPDVLAIVGSVKFACPTGESIARALIVRELAGRPPRLVVSGGAKGVDTIGVATAARLGFEYREHYPKYPRWQPDGFKARNLLIVADCTRLLAIRCAEAKTYGSGWTRDEAKRRGKPTRTVTIHRDGRVDDTGWPSQPNPDEQGVLPL